MSHLTARNSYKQLTERLNRFPQGAPSSESLYKILGILFSEQEAFLVSKLPIKPFTAQSAARVWNINEVEAEKVLETLADKALLLDMESGGTRRYVLPPPMAGFFEFSLMRTREDLDQKVLAELFYQYLNVEEDFIRDVFAGSETPIVRAFVHEPVLSKDNLVSILDYEKAGHIIDTATHMGVSMCYCRHKMEHLGQNCDASMDICMTFNNTADSLIRHGYARRVDKSECRDLLRQAYDENLVQCGENVQNRPAFICNCCGCCCEALVTAKKLGSLHPVQTTRFLPLLDEEKCSGCGVCVRQCPIDAIEITVRTRVAMKGSDASLSRPASLPQVMEDICLGCGLCVKVCPRKAFSLTERKEHIITPVNSAHKAVVMAIEKGMLQELIFDNQAFGSHRAMAAILGVILKLPPVKQIMASEQIKSRYLGRLLEKKQ